MSNMVMARLRPLNMPLLRASETHGRRLDATAKARKVRDEASLTWVPDGIDGDPLALADRLADHVAGAMVPKGKAKAQHMLVKLPTSVPVETLEQAQAALELVVQFAQDTFGGAAVFSARMDRDERSLNSVDVFLAPRYEKVTKRDSKPAVSMTRFTKLLVEKHAVAIEQDSARGSMAAQGKALQTELAQWLTARGFEAQRGKEKTARGADWVPPEIAGARIELEKDRAALDALVAETVPRTMQDRTKAKRLLAEAALVKAEAEAAHAAAATILAQAQADADRLASKVVEDRELRLVEDRRAVSDDRVRVDRDRRNVDLAALAIRQRQTTLAGREARVADQAGRLAGLIEKLEPILAVVAHAHDRLQQAPDHVRRWFDGDGRVGEAVRTVGPIVGQAAEILRKLVKRPEVAQPVPAEEVDLATLAAARDGRNGRDV